MEWVDWFNNRRLLEPIGNIPPVEYEDQYYETMQRQRPQHEIIKYGNDLLEERIDVRICPESPDLGQAHTSGTFETSPRQPRSRSRAMRTDVEVTRNELSGEPGAVHWGGSFELVSANRTPMTTC